MENESAKKLLKIFLKLLKIYLIEIAFFIIVFIITLISLLIQFTGKVFIEEGEGWFDDLYRYDPVMYFISMVTFSGLFLLLYRILMRKNTKQIAEHHVVFMVIYCLIAAFFCFVMWFVLLIVMTFGNCEPKIFSFITRWGWPVFTVLYIGIDVEKALSQKSR